MKPRLLINAKLLCAIALLLATMPFTIPAVMVASAVPVPAQPPTSMAAQPMVAGADSIQLAPPTDPNEVQYLLITNDTLLSAFQPLLDWKTKKGVPAQALTTSYIDSHYEGASQPLRIKAAIKDYYENRGTIWVALGGGISIVPTYKCYGHISANPEDATIPTDMFYAGLDSMDWNGDGDSKPCETLGDGGGDTIDLTPEVFVGRFPVATAAEATIVVNKSIAYEKNTPASGFVKNMVLIGNRMWNTGDAQAKLEGEWNDAIAPYWDGTHNEFFDTYTDLVSPPLSPTDKRVTSANVSSVLNSNKYNFVDFATHGSTSSLALQVGSFNATAARALNNSNYFFLSSIACDISWFDKTNDTGLAKAFLVAPSGGAIGVFSASRVGWEDLGGAHGPSGRYDMEFYKDLLTGQPVTHPQRMGAVVALAKTAFIGETGSNSQMRWNQMNLDLLGDPELPLYTQDPSTFNPAFDTTIPLGPQYYAVETGAPYATVALSKGSEVYEYGNADASGHFETVINPSTEGTLNVTITKINYRPNEGTVTVSAAAPARDPAPLQTLVPRGTRAPDPAKVITWFDNLETDQGWLANPYGTDTATTGMWERGVPAESMDSTETIMQVGFGASMTYDLVTGAARGASVTANAVNGVTSVRSPAITLPAKADHIDLSFAWYLGHLGDATPGNYLKVQVEGSSTKDVLEDHGRPYYDGEAYWGGSTIDITEFAGQTVNLLVTVYGTPGNGTEAAIDDVLIMTTPHKAIGAALTTGARFEGAVATFADSDLAKSASDYSATIEWGDGSSSSGIVEKSYQGVLSTDYRVRGLHVYAAERQYAVSVSVSSRDKAFGTGVSTVYVDLPPSVAVTGVEGGAVYILGAVPAAGCDTQDPSGVATPATVHVTGGNANGVGLFTATCSGAVDQGGNAAAPVSVSYTVVYAFSGFSAPVANPPALNSANAGQTIPLKWRLTNAQGSPIRNLTGVVVTAESLACSVGATIDQGAEAAAGASGLQNLGNGYYQFNWKTPKSYAHSCKTLKLGLGEGAGQERTARFQFLK